LPESVPGAGIGADGVAAVAVSRKRKCGLNVLAFASNADLPDVASISIRTALAR
jgi:hypothetical protein